MLPQDLPSHQTLHTTFTLKNYRNYALVPASAFRLGVGSLAELYIQEMVSLSQLLMSCFMYRCKIIVLIPHSFDVV